MKKLFLLAALLLLAGCAFAATPSFQEVTQIVNSIAVQNMSGRATNLLVFSTSDTLIGFTASLTNTAFDIDYNLNSPDPVGYVNFVSVRTNQYNFAPASVSALSFLWGPTSSSLLKADGSVTATKFTGSGLGLTNITPQSLSTPTNNVKGTTNFVLIISGTNSFYTNVIPSEMLTSAGTATNALQLGGNPAANFLTNYMGTNVNMPNGFTASTGTVATLVGITTLSTLGSGNIDTALATVNTSLGAKANTNAPAIQNAKFNGTLQLPSGTQLNTDASGTTAGVFWSGTTLQLGSATRFGWDTTVTPDGAGTATFIGSSASGIVSITGAGSAGTIATSTGIFTNGVTTLATNTLTFTAVSSCTNTLPQGDGFASLSAGTAVVLQDRFGNTVDTIGTIATLHVLIPMRANMRLSGTGISCVMY